MSRENDVLEWIKDCELPGGGIGAYGPNTQPYPEVSGYLIPTLWNYGEKSLAVRLAEWLISIQNADGSWNGLNVAHRSFDTAAIVAGLRVTGSEVIRSGLAIQNGLSWLEEQMMDNGLMRVAPRLETHLYTHLAVQVLGLATSIEHWLPSSNGWGVNWNKVERTHYIAYALEGLLNQGQESVVANCLSWSISAMDQRGLYPYWVEGWKYSGGYCSVGTAQMAVIAGRLELWNTARKMLEGVEECISKQGEIREGPDSHTHITWAAKYYLDARLLL